MVIRFRKIMDAWSFVTHSMQEDAAKTEDPGVVDLTSPDGDPAKFLFRGSPARAIHIFNGYHLPIRAEWFAGVDARPTINGGEFEWYVFAIEPRREVPQPHYFICHYSTVRAWVLDFKAPRGRDWRNQEHWMATLRPFSDGTGYFRWGDEPLNDLTNASRRFKLDNLVETRFISPTPPPTAHGFEGGESEAHLQLKNYVAAHPEAIGLGISARGEIEHGFTTGDTVDVYFRRDRDHVTVVEIEVEGAQQLLIGVHQAIKYRALAAVETNCLEVGPSAHVGAMVVAYSVGYLEPAKLAQDYKVELRAVSREVVLTWLASRSGDLGVRRAVRCEL